MLATKKMGIPSRFIASLLSAALIIPATAPVAYAQNTSQQQAVRSLPDGSFSYKRVGLRHTLASPTSAPAVKLSPTSAPAV